MSCAIPRSSANGGRPQARGGVIRYSAAVVGLGKIGLGYDYDYTDRILTHARAFARHSGYDLIAGVDPDARQRRRFEQQYSRPAFTDCIELFAALAPEIIAVAVPTPLHASTLTAILPARPRAALCEKPLADALGTAKQMLACAATGDCTLAVNYVRRFDPGVQQLKQAIDSRQYGAISKGVVWYGGGLRHSGTHMVDLVRYLLGEALDYTVLSQGRRWRGVDPEPDFRVRFGAAAVYFLAARAEHFLPFHLELMAEGGRLVYTRDGREIYASDVRDDSLFPGHPQLAAERRSFACEVERGQWHVADALYRHLTERTAFISDGDSALRTQALVDGIADLAEAR
jgi:predicted dehydrogenase